MDPRTVEEQSQAEQENLKVYKRRWLVLFAMFSVILVVGLHRCLISIANILDSYLGVTIDNYDVMMQVSMYTILVSVLAMARALDYFGLRRIVSNPSCLPTMFKFFDLHSLLTHIDPKLNHITLTGVCGLRYDIMRQWIESTLLL